MREIIPMNHGWGYKNWFDEDDLRVGVDDSSFKVVNIPHANREIPYNYFDEEMYQFVSCYKRNFHAPSEWMSKCVYIDFEGVMAYAEVYLNGEFVGSHKGGYTPFSIDLTDKLLIGKDNCILVKVDSTERPDIPPFGYVIDYLTYGGIYREVSLRVVDNVFIEKALVTPKDVLCEKKKVDIKLFILNRLYENLEIKVKVEVLSKGKVLKESIETFKLRDLGENQLDISLEEIEGIKLWDIDDVNLYDFKVSILMNDDLIDEKKERIGFREAIFKKDGFFLNGRRVKIFGLNRHQSYPYVGYAMPKRVQRKDADILKYELGLNTVRTSHYPQSRHFLDRCDEIGLLVLEEIPGWQHIGDDEWKEVAIENVKEMILRDYNRPSIISWGVRINESKDDHDFYFKTNNLARELDKTRQTNGVRFFPNSEFLEDIYTMNDFIHEGGEVVLREPREVTGLDRDVPYLVTENNGHMFPTKRFDNEERLVEHSMRHLRGHNVAGQNDLISGIVSWCAFDYNTHGDFGSGDRICYHGVMDMFRIHKMAGHFYMSQRDRKHGFVLEPGTIWARGERCKGGIDPVIVFTNCDYIELSVDGKFIGMFHGSGEYKGVKFPPVVINEGFGSWGDHWVNGEFTGYSDGKLVIKKRFARNPIATRLEAKADDLSLFGDGIDATRVVFKILDQEGNMVPYINEFIKFDISGEGEIIGPSETALIGGCIAVWVKTKEAKGEIKLSAKCSRFKSNEIEITVR